MGRFIEYAAVAVGTVGLTLAAQGYFGSDSYKYRGITRNGADVTSFHDDAAGYTILQSTVAPVDFLDVPLCPNLDAYSTNQRVATAEVDLFTAGCLAEKPGIKTDTGGVLIASFKINRRPDQAGLPQAPTTLCLNRLFVMKRG